MIVFINGKIFCYFMDFDLFVGLYLFDEKICKL